MAVKLHIILEHRILIAPDLTQITQIHLIECGSTNDEVLSFLAENTDKKAVMITANLQTKGRGQRGNKWQSDQNKNIMLSFGFRLNPIQAQDQFFITFLVSLGLIDFLSELGLKHAKIKWPNDIYINDQKIAGILIENILAGNQIAQTIIGIGVNINQVNFDYPIATSLALQKPNDIFDVTMLIAKLKNCIVRFFETSSLSDFTQIKANYTAKLYRKDEWHYYKKNNLQFLGKILGVSPAGKLFMETEHSVELFDFKEVEHIIN